MLRGGSGPRFKHDCMRCEWLGRLDADDIYFCAQGDPHGGIALPTVVRRFGNAGADYTSGWYLAAELPRSMRARARMLHHEVTG